MCPGSQRKDLEHHLHARDHLIELVLPKPRIRLPEIGPGVNVIDHQFDIVAVDVVIEPAGDGVDAVVAFLPWIQVLPLDGGLELLRDQEITSLNVETVRRKVGEPWRRTVDSAAIDVLL